MIKKPHPPSQKEKSFSLGTFGTQHIRLALSVFIKSIKV